MATEVGHIATLLETAFSGETPLEQKLDQAGRRLLGACLTIVAIVFGLGLLRGSPPLELCMSAVSLAVAAIPEGLPAIVTVALALGGQRMSRRAALVRRLASVETLGCTEVVYTDKTGTLTVGEMTVRRLVAGAGTFHVTGEGYAPAGAVLAGGQPVPPEGEACGCSPSSPAPSASSSPSIRCPRCRPSFRVARSRSTGTSSGGAGACAGVGARAHEARSPAIRPLLSSPTRSWSG
jgi:magnesium-transporting ATPase (P-type)